MGARITKHPEPFLITGPGLHTPPGAGNGKLLETNSDKLLEKKKKNPVRNCIARDQTWSGETADKAIRDAMCLRCSD